MQISLTMWAHAHGLVSLYHHGHFRMDEETFRQQVKRSGSIMLLGMAEDDLAGELADGAAEGLPTGVQG
jgi:hypothetical protein